MKLWAKISVLALIIISFIISTQPIRFSTYPYNLDSLIECRAADHIARHGNLNYDRSSWMYLNNHSRAIPFQNVILAIISLLSGVEAILIAQYFQACIFAISIVGWGILAKKLTNDDFIMVGTTALFTLLGSYVMIGVSVWKEALGLAIMPYIFYLYFSDRRTVRALALGSLLILPLVHHYVSIITYLTLSYICVFEIAMNLRKHREILNNLLYLSYICFLWVYMFVYYSYFNFNRLEFISMTSDIWLLFSILVLFMLLGIRILYSEKKMKIDILKLGFVMGIIIGIILVAIYVPLFPDATTLINAIPLVFTYLSLVPFAVLGGILISRSRWKYKSFYISSLFSPLTMLTFGILRGYDISSFVIIFRTFDFLDFSISISTFIGLSYLSKIIMHRKGIRVKEIMLASTILILAISTPTYTASYEIFGVENYVESWCVDALKYLSENNISNYSSDVYLYEIGRNMFDLYKGNSSLPYFLFYNYTIPSEYIVVYEKWKFGAQLYPEKSIPINMRIINSILEKNEVVYIAGPPGKKIYVIRTSNWN